MFYDMLVIGKGGVVVDYMYLEEYYVQTFDHFEMDFHQHSRLEIMLVITGECQVRVKSHVNEALEVNMKSGDYIVISPHTPHLLDVQKGQPCRIICAEFVISKNKKVETGNKIQASKSFEQYYAALPPYIVLKDKGVLRNTLIQLIQEKNQLATTEDAALLVELLTIQAVTLIGRDYLSRSKASMSLSYVHQAVEYIDEHFEEEFSIQCVANTIGVSMAYLQRLFKQHMKMTLTEYILSKRIEKAKVLLDNTKIAVSDICFLVGFNHRQYFTQQFTKLNGLSPYQYRKSHINQWVTQEVNKFR